MFQMKSVRHFFLGRSSYCARIVPAMRSVFLWACRKSRKKNRLGRISISGKRVAFSFFVLGFQLYGSKKSESGGEKVELMETRIRILKKEGSGENCQVYGVYIRKTG